MGSLVALVGLVVVKGDIRVVGAAALAVTAVGLVAIPRVERLEHRKDPSLVVIDEVAGMWLSMIGWPLTWGWLAAGFLLFRLFDVWKPFPIRRVEAWPGGWGVMADDVLAAVYVQCCLYGWVYLVGKG